MEASTNTSKLLYSVFADRGVIAILSLIINATGLSAYFIFIYILIKHRKEFNSPFYSLVLALAVPHCFNGILELIYAIPARLVDERHLPYWYQSTIGFISVSSWFMLVSITVVISFNRLIAVLFINHHKRLFAPNRLTMVIFACYLYGLGVSAMIYACQCRLGFPDYVWLFDCNFNYACASTSLKVNEILTDTCLVLIIIFYLVVFIQIKRRYRSVSATDTNEHFRKELPLVFQFAIALCSFLTYELTFWIISTLMTYGWISWRTGAIIINMCCNISSSFSPFVYLIFSPDIRKKLFLCLPKIRNGASVRFATTNNF